MFSMVLKFLSAIFGAVLGQKPKNKGGYHPALYQTPTTVYDKQQLDILNAVLFNMFALFFIVSTFESVWATIHNF